MSKTDGRTLTDRTATQWSCDPDAETLFHETPEDAAYSWLDDQPKPWPTEVTVYGWAPMRPRIGAAIAEDIVGMVLDSLDEEYGNPDGDDAPISEEARTAMLQAAARFLRVVERNYASWACERICERIVKVDERC